MSQNLSRVASMFSQHNDIESSGPAQALDLQWPRSSKQMQKPEM